MGRQHTEKASADIHLSLSSSLSRVPTLCTAALPLRPARPFLPVATPPPPFAASFRRRPTPRPVMTSYCGDVVYDVTVVPQFRSSIGRARSLSFSPFLPFSLSLSPSLRRAGLSQGRRMKRIQVRSLAKAAHGRQSACDDPRSAVTTRLTFTFRDPRACTTLSPSSLLPPRRRSLLLFLLRAVRKRADVTCRRDCRRRRAREARRVACSPKADSRKV